MKLVFLIGAGFYFGYLLSKAGIQFNTALYWQFFVAQALLIIGGSL